MTIKLSICIPTYNRARFLQECLAALVPQVTSDEVEVVVIDNCSEDDTGQVVQRYAQRNPLVRYFRNEKNLGYSGNQKKCFEYTQGMYTAILCDDDLYLDGEVAEIVKIISGKQEYAFLALNYYNFVEDAKKPYQSDFAPDKDVVFKRAYDILNYPSVGHFSGFIFNTHLAKKTLTKMLSSADPAAAEKHRGLISELSVRVTTASTLPSYFIGARKLAARIPFSPDYDILKHLCLEYYEFYLAFYQEGIISRQDLDFRIDLVMDRLPKAIIKDLHKFSPAERKDITRKLNEYFGEDKRFVQKALPWLNLGKNALIRHVYRFVSSVAAAKRKLVCSIRK